MNSYMSAVCHDQSYFLRLYEHIMLCLYEAMEGVGRRAAKGVEPSTEQQPAREREIDETDGGEDERG